MITVPIAALGNYIYCDRGHVLAQALPDGRALFKHGGRMALVTDVYCDRCRDWKKVGPDAKPVAKDLTASV